MNESKFQYIDEEKELTGEEYSDSEVEESRPMTRLRLKQNQPRPLSQRNKSYK